MNDEQSNQLLSKLINLSDFDKAIVEMIIEEPGISNLELARRLNKNRYTIKAHRESDAVSNIVKDIQISDIQYKIELRYKALKTIENLMTHEDGKVALGAAKAIVDNMEPTQINVNDVTGFKFVLPEHKKDE